MRILIVGRTKKISVESGLYRAFTRMGHTVAHVDDRKLRQLIGRRAANQWLRARVRAYRPEQVFFFKPHDVDLEVITEIARRSRTTMWYRDLTVPPDPEMIARARLVDTVFITAGGQLDEWKNAGVANVHWLPNAADRDLDKPVEPHPDFACDVAFIGRGYDDYRAEFLCRLAERFHVRVWGQDWQRWAKELNWDGTTVFGSDFARVCASARILIDINPSFWASAQVPVYSSNRMVRVLACRGFCLSQIAPGLDELFRDRAHCAWYDGEAQAVERIEQFLTDEAARERIRDAGHSLVWQHHMLDNRVAYLLSGERYANPLVAT